MAEYVRCELKRIQNGSLTVKRCDKYGIIRCEIPHWLPENIKPGANLLVKVERGYYRILQVLRLEPLTKDFLLKSINSWKDCTRMNAFTVDGKLTSFCEDALSFNKCLNHKNCSIVGVHIIDVASFYPDEPTEENDNIRTEIRENIFVNTGSTISIRGYKPRMDQASISIFLHTSLNVEENFEQTKPEATMIRISRQYSFQDVERQTREGHCEVDWKTLFEFAWKFRQYDNKQEPIYTFYNTWVFQDPDGYVPSLLVQMYTRIMSRAIPNSLWKRKMPFPAIHFTLKMSDKFKTDFVKYIPYAIGARCYYKYLLNEKGESLSIGESDESIEVVILKHLWDQLVTAAQNGNVVQCGGILHAHHMHPFLVETYHHLCLTFKRVVVEDFEHQLSSKIFDRMYINFSRPGREMESILVQRICHHATVSDETKPVRKYIKETLEAVSDEESSEDENSETKDVADDGSTVGEATNCEVKEEASPEEQDEDTPNSCCGKRFASPEAPWREDIKHLISKPSIVVRNDDEEFTAMRFSFLTLENNELECCKIRSKDWLEIQNNFLCLGSNLPFDVEKAHKLCQGILKADQEKTPIETYTLDKDTGEFKDILFHAKPVNYHYYLSENLRFISHIISVANDIHKCALHRMRFNVVFPFYAQPENWKERCIRRIIFRNIKLELLENEYFQVVKPVDMKRDFPKPDQTQFVCITTWYERCVFFAHGENVVWEKDPSSTVIKILSSLKCRRKNPLLQTQFTYTIEFI